MNRPKLEPVERDDLPEADLEDALRMLLSPATERPRSENREPTREESGRRYRLERRG